MNKKVIVFKDVGYHVDRWKDVGYHVDRWKPVGEGILLAETKSAFKVKCFIFSHWFSKDNILDQYKYEEIKQNQPSQ